MSILNVFISSPNTTSSERRFDKSLSIATLKSKLEIITGIAAAHQILSLYNGSSLVMSMEGNDDVLLGAFPIDSLMTIQVDSKIPITAANQYTDVSAVEKFELNDDQYDSLQDSVRAFKKRNKLGRFGDQPKADETKSENETIRVTVGDRCLVDLGSGMEKRGTVRFVGKTQFKPGIWVGIRYDEPVGKNDGSVQGIHYFDCLKKYGGFVRQDKVKVGDYPELNIDSEEELEEI